MTKKFLAILVFLSVTLFTNAQPVSVKYRNPLDLPVSLSANFGEIRPNHFHSGLDFRVGGVSGAKIYAVADGYVARINISPWGYGNALYINHPNGQTSVYGHMNGYCEKVRKYIEALQYERKIFAIDEKPEADVLLIKKGELIGYAGNTGSSFGAHLHFEIRDTESQATTNPVTSGKIKVTDNVPPTIHQMAVFTFDSTFNIAIPRLLKSSKVIKKGNSVVPEGNEIIEVHNPVYFGIWANDYQPNSTSKQGINHMTAYLDNKPFFGYAINEYKFDETRYINSFIAYEEMVKNNRNYVKTYIEPGNKLSIYKNVFNNGLIILNDTSLHSVHMDLFDDNGNKTTLAFKIKLSKKSNPNHHNLFDPKKYRPIFWNKSFVHETANIKVSIPEESLYSNSLFTIDSTTTKKGLIAPTWTIGSPNIPLQKRMSISFKPEIKESIKAKAVIVKVNKDNKLSSVFSTWDSINHFISASVSEFGTYSVAIDTIPPTVKVSFKTGANLRAKNSLTITISDNLSGIATYNGYIDGHWALFVYDAKSNSLTYRFDASRIKKGQKHKLKVVVDDACKNTTTFNTNFTW